MSPLGLPHSHFSINFLSHFSFLGVFFGSRQPVPLVWYSWAVDRTGPYLTYLKGILGGIECVNVTSQGPCGFSCAWDALPDPGSCLIKLTQQVLLGFVEGLRETPEREEGHAYISQLSVPVTKYSV